MAVRELPRTDRNERLFVDEWEDEDGVEQTAILHLNDNSGVLRCFRCDTERNISFACIHLERVRDALYR